MQEITEATEVCVTTKGQVLEQLNQLKVPTVGVEAEVMEVEAGEAETLEDL
jgi:hypothetical protein